jgi:hypothetical protein
VKLDKNEKEERIEEEIGEDKIRENNGKFSRKSSKLEKESVSILEENIEAPNQ